MLAEGIVAGAAEDAHGVNEPASLLEELRRFEQAMTVASLSEAIRLLESDCFDDPTAEHIREVGEYRPIQLGDKRFFETIQDLIRCQGCQGSVSHHSDLTLSGPRRIDE